MKFQAIKGVRDILPPESALWNRVEQAAREVFHTYGYGEIRLPIFEPTELFARSVGLDTDIVSKEMYSFEDSPEGLEADRRRIALVRPDLGSTEQTQRYLDDVWVFVNRLEQAERSGVLPTGNAETIRKLKAIESKPGA